MTFEIALLWLTGTHNRGVILQVLFSSTFPDVCLFFSFVCVSLDFANRKFHSFPVIWHRYLRKSDDNTIH